MEIFLNSFNFDMEIDGKMYKNVSSYIMTMMVLPQYTELREQIRKSGYVKAKYLLRKNIDKLQNNPKYLDIALREKFKIPQFRKILMNTNDVNLNLLREPLNEHLKKLKAEFKLKEQFSDIDMKMEISDQEKFFLDKLGLMCLNIKYLEKCDKLYYGMLEDAIYNIFIQETAKKIVSSKAILRELNAEIFKKHVKIFEPIYEKDITKIINLISKTIIFFRTEELDIDDGIEMVEIALNKDINLLPKKREYRLSANVI